MSKGKPKLKLIIVYDAEKNQYGVSAHNLPPEEADKLLLEWNQHLVPHRSLMALDQKSLHRTTEPSACRACRDTVRKTSGLDPKPKFVRREL